MQGVNNILTGTETVEGGLAQMVLGWLPVLDTTLRWSIGQGADAVAGLFTVAEQYANPLPDNKKQGARLAVIGTDLLGLSEDDPMPDVLKNKVKDTARAAIAIRHFYGDDKLKLATIYGHNGKRRTVITGVPASDMFDLLEKQPDGAPVKLNAAGRKVANAIVRDHKGRPLTEAQLINRVLTREMTCDGAIDGAYGKTWATSTFCSRMFQRGVAAGILPPAKPRTTGDDVGEHASKSAITAKNFSAQIERVRDWLAMCNAPDGEVQIAPTKEQEAILDAIAEQWAAYRAAHPMLF